MNRPSLLLVLALSAPALAHAGDAPLLVPAHPDSTTTESAPAPLLVPGRTTPTESLLVSPRQRAREQYAIGREMEKHGAPASAIASYRNAVRLDPKIPDAHYRMAMLFTRVGQYRVAAGEFAAELRNEPGNLPSARGLGLALAQAGDTAAAVRQLESLVRRDPRDEPSWQALGFAYGAAQQPLAAEAALRRAVTLDPKDSDAWRDLGVVLVTLHREREARDAYTRAIRLGPHDATPLVNLGNLDRREQKPDSALAHYRAAIARDSTQLLAYQGILQTLHDLGRDDEIGPVYRRLVEVNPADLDTRMQAMHYFGSRGRSDVALELARGGVQADPTRAEAHLTLGMAYQAAGGTRPALVELRRAQTLFRLPEQRRRVGEYIRAMRAGAPDSLRGVFAADSLANEGAAPRDSLPAPGRAKQGP